MSYSYLYKLIIVGDTAVGKSCLLLQYTDTRFKQQHDITIGVEYGTKAVSHLGKNIRLQIWDTAGAETFKSITRTYYKGVAGALIVFDITRRETFKNVVSWLEETKEYANPHVSLVLVGNKSDLDGRETTYEEASAFAQENGMEYIETSAKTGMNVERAFEQVVGLIYQKVEQGEIDITQDTSGVRIGNELRIEQVKGVKDRFSLSQSPYGAHSKGTCPC